MLPAPCCSPFVSLDEMIQTSRKPNLQIAAACEDVLVQTHSAQHHPAWPSSLRFDQGAFRDKAGLSTGHFGVVGDRSHSEVLSNLNSLSNLTNQCVASYYWKTCECNKRAKYMRIRNETTFQSHKPSRNLKQLLLLSSCFFHSLNPAETITNQC